MNENERVRRATVKALQLAGAWLAEAMRIQVGYQTDIHDGPGSPVGTPPFRRTGYGQSTIGVEMTTDGCRVGVTPMTSPPPGRKKMSAGIKKMEGQNYLAGHDTGKGVRGGQKRPWMSVWVAERRPEVDRIIRRYFDELMKVQV